MYSNNYKKKLINVLVNNHFVKYPTPYNMSYFWNLGFISFFFLIIQLVSGILLAMHYCSDVSLAFNSVEHIMRDVNYGWLIRYMHSNGASFFFIAVYIHMGRGLYYSRFSFENYLPWITGMTIFVLMMATAFIGYVLPWGQMSFWGATVITNLVSAIPYVGARVVYWLWGGFSVGGPTLSKFFSLHYLLPFFTLFVALVHMTLLHERGSSNPSFVSPQINRGYLPLYPYFIIKDMVGLWIFIFFYFVFLFYYPNSLGHTDNYIEANPMSTPEHIVPEWYFLPFYAILRSIPYKLMGVFLMGMSIFIFFLLPFLSFINYRYFYNFKSSPYFTYVVSPFFSWIFFFVFLLLGWIGAKPVEDPYIMIGQVLCFLFFSLFIFNFIVLWNLYAYFIIKNKSFKDLINQFK